MHTQENPWTEVSTSETLQVVLREAKRLHKAAASAQLSLSLPVLRRVLGTGTLQRIRLPELQRQRSLVQRKHILRMLAIEAGYSRWEHYRKVLLGMQPEQLLHFDVARHEAGHLNLWFPSLTEAQAHASAHGGRAMPVGQHGVVIADR